MRTALATVIIAASLAATAQAQDQAPVAAPAPIAAPAAAPVTAPGDTAPAQTAAPAAPAPDAAPAPVAEAPPTLPTTGDGAVIINFIEKVCVPLVRGGKLDDLAKAQGMKLNRRDASWTMPLGGDKNYTLTVLPLGSNKDVCRADVHYATGQADPIVKALVVWSFLHQPELILQANYVNVDGDGIKRIRKSWEHFDSAESRAVNFTTLSKPDDTPLNKNFDSGEVYYQERKF
jgi:hypothetical protein